MAKFISSIGQITGKLGGVVFKTRGNKTYIAKAPEHIKPANDPATKLRRKRFAWVGKFTAVVNSSPLLKALWNSSSSRSVSAFNKIFKQVFSTFPGLDYTGPILFTPNLGFSLPGGSIVFGKTSVFIETASIGHNAGINPSVETSIVAVGIMVLSNPIDESAPEDHFLSVQSVKNPISLDSPSVFIIPLSGSDICAYQSYRTKKAYFVLVTLDASGKPVHYSEIIS